MKLRRTLVVLGLAGALAVTAVAGTAMAQTPTPSTQTGTNYQEYFLDRLASALGTTRDQLTGAFTQARNETADQAVKDGKLTQEQADRLKARQGAGPFGFHGFRGDMGRGDMERGGKMGGFMGGGQTREAIAGALGITTQELDSQLRSGKTLAELAAGKEQAVKDAIVAAEKTRLDQAVADGKITQAQEDARLEQLRNADLNSLFGHPSMEGRGEFRFRGDGTQPPAPATSPSRGTAVPAGQSL